MICQVLEKINSAFRRLKQNFNEIDQWAEISVIRFASDLSIVLLNKPGLKRGRQREKKGFVNNSPKSRLQII